jgi:hypothetical protein
VRVVGQFELEPLPLHGWQSASNRVLEIADIVALLEADEREEERAA